MSKQVIDTDVVVIGAGYAGIAAARKLYESQTDFVVVEARDRIGGRTYTQKLKSGATVDLGAQWIGPTQKKMWQWVEETGTKTFSTYDSGKNILSYKNRVSTYKGTIPKIDPISLIDLGNAIRKIDKISKEVSIEKPWEHPRAHEFDSMTLHTWIQKNMFTPKAKMLFKVGIETVFAAEPQELSLLHALFYSNSGDSMESLISIENGAQQTLLVGGTQTLLKKIAVPFDDRIYLNNPVTSITQEEGVIVETPHLIIRAQKCIATLPPTLYGSIKFNPALPQMKAQLIQRMPMGAAMKCFCIYEKPFWREKGFSGQIVSDEMPVKVTFDCTNSSEELGVLLVFVEAQDAREFIDKPRLERKRAVLESLVKYFGIEALNVLEYEDKCWTEEEYSRGCYVGNVPPGVITQFKDTVRQPFMHVNFAGTETATRWNGYMEGAILSGERAVKEVLTAKLF